MAGKSTTRVRRRRRVPALRNHVRPARSVAPHSSHEPLAVGRTREAIHRGPIENSRRAPRARTDSTVSVRAKPVALAERKVALVVARVVWAVASAVVREVVGRIDLVPGQEVPPGASVAVGSDGGKKKVSNIECRGSRRRRGEGGVSGVEGNSLDPHPSTLDPGNLM